METRYYKIQPNHENRVSLEPEEAPVTDLEVVDRLLDKNGINYKDLEWEEKRQRVINNFLDECSLVEYLKFYGIPDEFYENLEKDKDYYEITVPENEFIPKLNEVYGFSGGAARSLLLRALGIDPNSKPRDLDVVRIGENFESDEDEEDRIAKIFNAEDLKGGYGVQHYADLEKYFSTRDFTINEILIFDGKLVFTWECLEDTIRGIIRLTDYEIEKAEDFGNRLPKYKLLAKAIRLESEGELGIYPIKMSDELKLTVEQNSIHNISLALHFSRALEKNETNALNYLNKLKSSEQIPPDINSVEDGLRYFSKNIREKEAYFRRAPWTQFTKEVNDILDKLKEERVLENPQY